jgi:hypothetical protein
MSFMELLVGGLVIVVPNSLYYLLEFFVTFKHVI